jgi:hypothetical protein
MESKKDRNSKGRISRTYSSNGIERSSGGRHSLPFMIVEEQKDLPIQKKQGETVEEVLSSDEPSIATNIQSPSKLPEKIHDVA